MNAVPLDQFSIVYIVLTVLVTIIVCYTGIVFVKRVKRVATSKMPTKTMVLYAAILGVMFWISHIFISLSTGLPLDTAYYGIYIIINFLLCFVASFCAIWVAQFEVKSNFVFLMASVFIAVAVMAANVTGFYTLFNDYIQVNVPLSLLTVAMTISMTVPMLRYLLLITNEGIKDMRRGWEWVGTIATGFALAGIPYIILIAMLDYTAGGGWILLPFIFTIFTNLILLLIPDFLGNQYQMRNAEAFRSLFHHNPNAVFSTDKKGKIVEVNEEASRLTGYTDKELANLDAFHFFGGRDKERVRQYFDNILAGNVERLETKLKMKDGEERDVKITAVRTIVQGRIIGVFGLIEDITEQLKAKKTIEHLAYHDELTGLPNRRKLNKVTDKLKTEKKDYAFLMMDFDRFKRVNDTFGHSFGDELLIVIGNYIRQIAEKYNASAIRLGGDEFLVVCQRKDASLVSEEILENFNEPMTINGVEILLTASVGWTDSIDSEDPITLLKYADMTMYVSKEEGGNRVTKYDPTLFREEEENLSIERELIAAIHRKELTVHYQPKYVFNHSYSPGLVGAEALVRWNHKGRGMISPGIFIPIAEKSKLIVDLEKHVIQSVVAQIQKWKAEGVMRGRVSINISMDTLFRKEFVPYLVTLLSSHNVEGTMIELEITERIVMKNEDDLKEKLQRLHKLGIRISLDDFGTGYSSLSYLDHLNIDILKIDQSFVHKSMTQSGIIAAIVQMAENLSLEVIAEGVETKEQAETLADLGCDRMQGYYFGHPSSPEDYEASFLHSWSRDDGFS
ncbi:putative bifunctional diguanylate cyclase/phosphodiesterase [Salimicrobium halophilum]|uniref:PAS domain S-box-containing protein/diguanylate cyclase (GGDEF) domain-containing protein n=1 Tax=Salimicrobium halophilum TaxID=86666 RepID=A0A1G8R7E8_9BACI|nr:GGDEF domain-containing phosphodiesterase [Salimicrobium halophilum]SDJ12879.1 PAS domain S-box-containing protein/diguanylate cyclase (GGDEF) domain-containing protein [Salimicrobium halophilum]